MTEEPVADDVYEFSSKDMEDLKQNVTTFPPPAPAVASGVSAATPVANPMEFEKTRVARSEIKFTGNGEVELYDDTTVGIDDRLRLVGEFRVVKVVFGVDEKTGDLVRTQFIKPVNDLQLVPWDPSDPSDDGIARMRR